MRFPECKCRRMTWLGKCQQPRRQQLCACSWQMLCVASLHAKVHKQILCKPVDAVKPEARNILEVMKFKTSTSTEPEQRLACADVVGWLDFGGWSGEGGWQPLSSNFLKGEQSFVPSLFLLPASTFQYPNWTPKPALVVFLVLFFNRIAPEAR